ncbi:MAG TPA: NAD-dependent epimerase/dehydratase family protein [Gemmatimonadaceae bacterium]|nr:NAD-dependent epimerase/dehydratase family protein [Gemmatimonadaceae bacterium]
MNVLIFGATGMVGQGVLRECLLDPRVRRVLVVGRSSLGRQHDKLREIVLQNLSDLSAIGPELASVDACFFCLGVSSAGMSEEAYAHVTYDLTLSVAGSLARLAPGMTFVYVSGAGTDGTEQGRVMWARVKGRTENALLRLPFKAAYMFRPAAIIPLHGITSRTTWYRVLYAATRPLWPVLRRLAPDYVTTTERVGQAMINVAERGYPTRVLENPDINRA